MVWIVVEGLDKVGKSTVAKYYESKGFQVVHFSAPPKKYYAPGYSGPSYLDDLVEKLMPLSGQDVFFDRSAWGELVWPSIYGRTSLIDTESLEIISEIEHQNNTRRILLSDPDVEGHWRRCKEHNEPLDKGQFLLARQLFEELAGKYGFEETTFSELLSKERGDNILVSNTSDQTTGSITRGSEVTRSASQVRDNAEISIVNKNILDVTPLTLEQKRLLEANAINDVLSKPIVKLKGEHFQVIETKIRNFLNDELAVILGTKQTAEIPSFSNDEIVFLKTLIAKAGVKK
jgi:hypothetical protein